MILGLRSLGEKRHLLSPQRLRTSLPDQLPFWLGVLTHYTIAARIFRCSQSTSKCQRHLFFVRTRKRMFGQVAKCPPLGHPTTLRFLTMLCLLLFLMKFHQPTLLSTPLTSSRITKFEQSRLPQIQQQGDLMVPLPVGESLILITPIIIPLYFTTRYWRNLCAPTRAVGKLLAC